MLKSTLFAALLAVTSLPQTVSAQASFNGNYSQNFDSMGASGTAPPTGWKHLSFNMTTSNSTWTTSIPASGTNSVESIAVGASATTLVAITSPTSNQNNGYNAAASAGATSDRVISTAPSSVTGSGIQAALTNATGITLTSLDIAFDTVRHNAVSSANELPGYWVFISTNGTSWTNVTPNPTITTVPNTVGVTATSLTVTGLSIAPNAVFYVRWLDDNAVATSPDQIVGLNNVSIQLPISNNLPTTSITAPTTGSSYDAPATINLTADAADSDGTIAKVEFFAGVTKLGEDTTSPYEFTWTGVASGSYALTSQATDNVGATTTSTAVNVTVTNANNVSPTVALTAPANGATIATTSTTLTATASDTDGSVSKVEFFNGATKLGEDTSSPYAFDWTGLVNGSYTLTAVATDNDGGTATSAPVNVTVASPISTTLVAKGASWKYLDNGSDQGAGWKETAFNDSAWASGAAPLGYTDGHIVTTVFSPAVPNRYITTYFRRTFNVTGAAAVQSLNLNILRDDGVVVYINGSEVARQNMPAGAIGYLTNSATTVDAANETTYFPSAASPFPTLNEGSNTIAVELHQRDGSSSDLGFDLEMISLASPGTPPTVAISAPANNATYTAPAAVSITATANDSDGTVTKVEFFDGATKLGEDTTSPYEFAWIGVVQGSYSLTAKATDNAGLITTSEVVNIIVNPPDTTPPTVAVTAPLGGAAFTAPATIAITADAADSDGTIAKVEFFNGATKLGEDTAFPYEFSWNNVPAGSYVLTAKATDNLTASTSSAAVNITVNPNQSPTINLVTPANTASAGSSGMVNLTATIADPEAAPLTVTFYGRPKVAPPGADFTLVTIPDTQFYSENVSNRLQYFTSQTNWIVASKNSLNTQFVAHMGDMTQSYNTVVQEYINADGAMAIIENPATTLLTHGIPWGGAPGNHDIASGGSTVMWNDYFGLARFATRTVANGGYFGGGYSGATDNNYQIFSASGMDFIVINLKYNSSTSGNQAVMDWADALLKANPNRRAIVTSHWLIGISFPPTQATWGGHGQVLYDNLKDNPNLFLMLSGHIHGEGRRFDTFEGRRVDTILQDYQGRSNGGDSWLRYYTFKPSENKIYGYTYKTNTAPGGSPLGGTYETDADSQFNLDYNMSATAAWTSLGTVNVPGGTSTASLPWTGLATNTEYEWYAAVSDSVNPAVGSSTRSFTTNGNAAPSVSLTSPANGASFNLPATIPLAATAADIDGTIAKIEFFNGATEVGEDTGAPFTFDWSAPVGSHSITARATDGQGATTDSAAVAITVIDPLPTVTLAATDGSAGEFGADQALVYTVTRSGSTIAPLSVEIIASGSASGADYSGFISPLVIPIGAANEDLNITVLPDAIAEGPETLTLTIAPNAAYLVGSPASGDATLADRPDQNAYFAQIADPAKRGSADDGDGDGVANSIERFMGTLVGDPSSKDILDILEPTPGTFKIRYRRALNRPELSGALRWTTDLTTWYASGETDGTLTVTFTEAVISAPGADPEVVETTAAIAGGSAPKAFVHLRVQ